MCKLSMPLCLLQLWILYQTSYSEEISNEDYIPVFPALNSQVKCATKKLRFSLETASQLSLKDLINNIKRSIVNTWNSLKKLAHNTKEKVKSWIEHVKVEAERVNKQIKKELEKLAAKINNIIKDLVKEFDVAKECLKNEKDNIHDILKNITSDVSSCISERLKNVEKLEDDSEMLLTDSNFLQNTESKLSGCTHLANKNIEECLIQAKEEISEESNIIEKMILDRRLESRQFSDDILAAIVKCSTEGLINASTIISNEMIQIINCIINNK